MDSHFTACPSRWLVFAALAIMLAMNAAFPQWDGVFSKLSRTTEWNSDLHSQLWVDNYLDSRESRRSMDAQFELYRSLLGELGLGK